MQTLKLIFIILLLIGVSYTIYAQIFKEKELEINLNTDRSKLIGSKFPSLKAQTLSKNYIQLPSDKPTILCIVFEQNSQAKVDTWTLPILEKYADSTIKYYEIPMIKSGFKWASGFICEEACLKTFMTT
jgi:hypothetical protein